MSETETQQPAQISLNDLSLMAKLIHVCTKRGAFEASEMKLCGDLYERLQAFLQQAQQAQQAQQSSLPSVNEGGEADTGETGATDEATTEEGAESKE